MAKTDKRGGAREGAGRKPRADWMQVGRVYSRSWERATYRAEVVLEAGSPVLRVQRAGARGGDVATHLGDYSSLTAAAQAVTGSTHGPLFWRVDDPTAVSLDVWQRGARAAAAALCAAVGMAVPGDTRGVGRLLRRAARALCVALALLGAVAQADEVEPQPPPSPALMVPEEYQAPRRATEEQVMAAYRAAARKGLSAEEVAELDASEALEHDKLALRTAWSGYLCGWQRELAADMEGLRREREASSLGGVVDLTAVHDWQERAMEARTNVREAKRMLAKVGVLACKKGGLVERISWCVVESSGDECVAGVRRYTRLVGR